MKALIVYYSLTGNTEKVSSILADSLKKKNIEPELIRVQPTKMNDSFVSKVFNSLTGKKVAINCASFDPREYDFIILGTPVWASQPTPAINTFLQDLPMLEGQQVCSFVTLKSIGDKTAVSKIKRQVEEKGGSFQGSISVKMEHGVNAEELLKIEHFIDTYIKENGKVLH